MIKKNTYLVVIKYYLGFIIIKTKEFRMEDSFAIFFINGKKLSLNMANISKHLNSTNQKINPYGKTIKTIVNLGSKKGENNNN